MKNQKIGRWLSEKNLKKLKNEYKFIIEYVKENADVLLGIRNEYINLYICGGSFLKLNLNNGKLSISTGYFKDEEKENKNSCDFDNKSIDEKKDELNKLKKIVSDYQKGITSKNKQGEKILQQDIVKAFNNKNSEYFALDMEYYIEGFKDYVYDKDNEYIYCYEKEKNEIEKDKKKTKMLGRADILLISKPNENNKIKLYFIEVKNGTGAYSGVSNKFITKENNGSVFGAGIIGHINNYVPIINAINSKSEAGQKIKSQYIKDRSSRDRANEKLSELNIKKYMEEEIRNKMSNYNYLELIENDNFKKINYEEIKIESAELIFYLGDCNPKVDFFKHLGIEAPSELKLKEYTKAKYSLVNLLNKTEEYEKLGLKFIENEDMIDFKYYIHCDNNQEIDINIENYKIISKDNFEIKVE